jgi:hypothetical protein
MKAVTLTLEADQVVSIRRALLVGLAAYGEIERLANVQQLKEMCRHEIPEDDRVIHPTGCSDTVGEFADALRLLELADSEVAEK